MRAYKNLVLATSDYSTNAAATLLIITHSTTTQGDN